MAVIASDMKFYLSGGSGNTNPNASLGAGRSTTEIVSNTLQNLFDNVSGPESVSGDTEYRCFYLRNTNGTDTLEDVGIWIDSNTPSASTVIAIGLDPNLFSPGGAVTIATESDAPAGVSFTNSPDPTSEGTALAIGDMPAGSEIAVWVRRTVTAGAASAANDPATIRIVGTPA